VKVVGNWIKLNSLLLHKLYLPPDIKIVKERKEVEWLVKVE